MMPPACCCPQAGWACNAVHGDKGQRDREEAVNAFKAGTAPLLIATDVAARGLDIPDVEVSGEEGLCLGRERERGGVRIRL